MRWLRYWWGWLTDCETQADERIRLRVEEGQRVMEQARVDQEQADFPGCCMGLMHCVDLTCWCAGNRPSRAFLLARCHRIRTGMDLES